MTDETTQKMTINRRQMSLKVMCFNRFLWIRYLLALFLICNLYWFIFSFAEKSITAIIPLMLLIYASLVTFEQIKLYREHQSELSKTKIFFSSQLLLNLVLLFIAYTPLYSVAFPFLNENNQTKEIVRIFLLVGILISIITIKKIQAIRLNQDKYHQRMKEYEQITNLTRR